LALAGSYRKVVVKPEKMSWKLLGEDSEGDLRLEVEFELPSSSYATVCLRDIIGDDINE
jgi:tRNA(Glu) U13 pseudouridine synthase TruD